MASELRTIDFQAADFKELELHEDPRRWSWLLDRRMIVSVLSGFTAATLLLTAATGVMTFETDPMNALAGGSAGTESRFDTSWSVEVHVIPEHPIGIELRKLSRDETIHFYEPRD